MGRAVCIPITFCLSCRASRVRASWEAGAVPCRPRSGGGQRASAASQGLPSSNTRAQPSPSPLRPNSDPGESGRGVGSVSAWPPGVGLSFSSCSKRPPSHEARALVSGHTGALVRSGPGRRKPPSLPHQQPLAPYQQDKWDSFIRSLIHSFNICQAVC